MGSSAWWAINTVLLAVACCGLTSGPYAKSVKLSGSRAPQGWLGVASRTPRATKPLAAAEPAGAKGNALGSPYIHDFLAAVKYM